MRVRFKELRTIGKAPSLSFFDPPHKGNFRRGVMRITERLIDSVTSSGILEIVPVVLERIPATGSITDEMLRAAVMKEAVSLLEEKTLGKEHRRTWNFSIRPFVEDSVRSTAEIVSKEVMNTDPRRRDSDVGRLARELERVVALLSLSEGGATSKVATARCAIRDTDPEGPPVLHFTVNVFLNLKTRKAIILHLVEGHL